VQTCRVAALPFVPRRVRVEGEKSAPLTYTSLSSKHSTHVSTSQRKPCVEDTASRLWNKWVSNRDFNVGAQSALAV
jgi:hypothetical protein